MNFWKVWMRKDINIITIKNLSHDGRGVGQLNGKTQFITNALPGETVQYRYLRTHKKFDEGIAQEIIQPSPNRISPKCEHFGVCGGCQIQHMSTEAQLSYKQNVVLEQLKHIGGVTPDALLTPISGDTYGYRTKARLGAKYVTKKQKMLVGFREVDGRFLADLTACQVLIPEVGQRLTEIAAILENLSCYDQIPQLEIASADNQDCILIIRNLANLTQEDMTTLKHFAEKYNFVICLQPGGYDSIYQIYPENNSTPELHYSIPNHDIKITFHPADFTQVNQSTNLPMIDQAIELLAPQKNEIILDLFCGLGNFTLPIARYAKHVTGIEGDANMIAKAKLNANLNQIDNTNFYPQNLFEFQHDANWMTKRYDKILLDPPRAGAEQISKNINHFSAERIVYISCNPATLARDAGNIVQHGYNLAKLGIINMFPQTAHVETIALFIKK